MASYVGPPPGTLFSFAGTAAPTGYLVCDGSSLLRATYADLFSAIGTTYGSVDGTHFTLPDLRGRVLVGKGSNASVNALNANDGQGEPNRRPHHRTSINDPGHYHTVPSGGTTDSNFASGSTAIAQQVATVTGTGGTNISVGTTVGTDALDAPSYIVVNHIIKF